jgi:putative CocE/NonD family hydrolase
VHEHADGADTLEWLAEQPWFSGRLGMWGASYLGYTQWSVAADAPEFLQAIVPVVTSTDMHALFYPGGAFSLSTALRWATGNGDRRSVRSPERRIPEAARTRPMRAATRAARRPAGFFEDWCDHPELDDYWRGINASSALASDRVPALSIAGTYDIFAAAQLEDFRARSASTWLDLGPYAHGGYAISARRLGWKQAGPLRMIKSSLDFLDHQLVDAPLERDRVRRYVQGEDRWTDEKGWPPPGARHTVLHLRAGGRLDREPAGSDEVPDRYSYDPADPVRTLGGTFLGPRCGPADQRPLATRADIIAYETPPLDQPLQIAGPVRLRLFAESDAPSTDFTAKLVHVPAGSGRPALNICDGVRRVTLAPNEPAALELDLWHASITLAPGDRLRLEVSSSNFPRYDAHPNVIGNPADVTRVRVAKQTIHHAADTPSQLEIFTLH